MNKDIRDLNFDPLSQDKKDIKAKKGFFGFLKNKSPKENKMGKIDYSKLEDEEYKRPAPTQEPAPMPAVQPEIQPPKPVPKQKTTGELLMDKLIEIETKVDFIYNCQYVKGSIVRVQEPEVQEKK